MYKAAQDFSAQQQRRPKGQSMAGAKTRAAGANLRECNVLGSVTNILQNVKQDVQKNKKGAALDQLNLALNALPHIQSSVEQQTVTSCVRAGWNVSEATNALLVEAKRKRKAGLSQRLSETQQRQSDDHRAVEEYVHEKKRGKMSNPSLPVGAKRVSKSPEKFGDETRDYPKPANGHRYSPIEVVTILDSFGEGPKATGRRARVKKEWIAKKLVGIQINGLNKFLRKVKASGNIPAVFGDEGRPRKLSIDELKEIASELRKNYGRTTDPQQFEKLVVERLKAKARKNGESTLGSDFKPCTQTVRTMMQILVQLQEQELLDTTPGIQDNHPRNGREVTHVCHGIWIDNRRHACDSWS